MSQSKILLVTDATGKQGGVIIQAICISDMSSTFNIIAVTRLTTSRSAQALASPELATIKRFGRFDLIYLLNQQNK